MTQNDLIDGHALPAGEWRWPHFKPAELQCKGDGKLLIVPAFMDRLERLRAEVGQRLAITSGYRSPAYNARVAATGTDGPHTTGRAVDILVRGADALDLLVVARGLGFTGFGIAQKGAVRYLHLDDLPGAAGQPRPWMWSY
jgi:uncharacterized protein YcbK (DUF882 family)